MKDFIMVKMGDWRLSIKTELRLALNARACRQFPTPIIVHFFFRYNIKSVNHQRLNVVLRFYDTLCVPPWSKVMNYDVLYWSQPKNVLKYLNIQIFSQNQSDRNWKRRQNLYEIWLDYDLHATRIWAMFSLAAKR